MTRAIPRVTVPETLVKAKRGTVRFWAVVLAGAGTLACYSYSERRVGNETQPIRMNRLTGRAEVLVRRSDGSSEWRPVLEAEEASRKRQASVETEAAAPKHPPVQVRLDELDIRSGVTGGRLLITITNRSSAVVDRLQVEITVLTEYGEYVSRVENVHYNEFSSFLPAGTPPIGLPPGETGTFEHSLPVTSLSLERPKLRVLAAFGTHPSQ